MCRAQKSWAALSQATLRVSGGCLWVPEQRCQEGSEEVGPPLVREALAPALTLTAAVGWPAVASLLGTQLGLSSEKRSSSLAPRGLFPLESTVGSVAASSWCFLFPSSKDLKTVPSLSLSLSLSVSQMAILLTAARKPLPSTVHSSPGVFVELFESQPAPPPV